MLKIAVIAIKHPTEPNLFLHGLRRDNQKWALAGGHFNDGESDYEAASRELQEETGLCGVKLNKLANEKFGDNDVHLYCCNCPQDFIPNSEDDPDSEFVTFKWLDPTAHGNLHVPARNNILIRYLNQTLGKSEDYFKNKLKKSQEQNLVHYSSKKGLKEIHPEKMGTGVRGLQYKRGLPENKSSFYYTEDSVPEEMVTRGAHSKYIVKPPANVYDFSKDPENFHQKVLDSNQGAWNEDLLHGLLRQHGYAGVKWSMNPKTHVVQLYHPQAVHEEHILKHEELYKNDSHIKNIANHYAKLNNFKLSHNYNVNINPEHGQKIASAYEAMQHQPDHPDVKASYDALIGETGKQFKHLINSGLKISRMQLGQENPYKNSKDMLHDLHVNNHLWYYPTEQGFGSEGQSQNHPMLKETEFKHNGTPLLANDVFRIVHDAFGHGLTNSTFGPKGEHASYLAHKEMFSPLAQKALASETMGQNSTVNFGKHAAHNRANPQNTIYAEQKAGLLPEHIINGKWHE